MIQVRQLTETLRCAAAAAAPSALPSRCRLVSAAHHWREVPSSFPRVGAAWRLLYTTLHGNGLASWIRGPGQFKGIWGLRPTVNGQTG